MSTISRYLIFADGASTPAGWFCLLSLPHLLILFVHPSFSVPFLPLFLAFLPAVTTSVPAPVTLCLQYFTELQLHTPRPPSGLSSLRVRPQHTHSYNINLQDGYFNGHLPALTSSSYSRQSDKVQKDYRTSAVEIQFTQSSLHGARQTSTPLRKSSIQSF